MPSPKYIIKILFHKLTPIISQDKINDSTRNIWIMHMIVKIMGQKYEYFVYKY